MRQRNGGTRAAPAVPPPPQAAADENHGFLRGLLARKEPDFARALAAVERELEQQVRDCPPKRSSCALCGRGPQRDRESFPGGPCPQRATADPGRAAH